MELIYTAIAKLIEAFADMLPLVLGILGGTVGIVAGMITSHLLSKE